MSTYKPKHALVDEDGLREVKTVATGPETHSAEGQRELKASDSQKDSVAPR
ncbi:hypothetical protein [Salinispora mooreana]|uniref:hypothetical protein n=1 Tax=Salinispora mooreana TaxID=999545 RepID=UPI00036018A9|nr:hypothetical protein [Salinispora mooreana]